MKFQLLSDLHNEFLRNAKRDPIHHWMGSISDTDADLIILAGDIDTGTQGAEWAIAESERLEKTIIYVMGNHEFYGHEYISMKQKIVSLCEGSPVICLDAGMTIQHDVRFIGATLWTDYKADTSVPQGLAMDYVNNVLVDHKKINLKSGDSYRKFKPLDALGIHLYELAWIEQQLAVPYDGKTVVITHHGPHAICQHPDYPASEISSAFHSDLSHVLDKYDIDVWAYGHTHANLDQVVNGTRIISNQAGYPGENVVGFDAELVIEL